MAEEHALLSPSGSKKWLTCKGSVAMEIAEGAEDTASFPAAQGTVAHNIAAKNLLDDIELDIFLGSSYTEDGHVIEVDQEMVDNVGIYTEYVKNIKADSFVIEQQVDFSEYVPEGKGFVDFYCLAREERKNVLHVVDLKYGFTPVVAFGNTQGMLYALGALKTFEPDSIDEVCITIVQPRKDSITEYRISVNELELWGVNTVKPIAYEAYKLAKDPSKLTDDDLFPSVEGCRWCKASKCDQRARAGYEAAVKGFCNLEEEEKQEVMKSKLDKKQMRNVGLLTNEIIAATYQNMKIFMSWAKDLEEEILHRLMEGEEVPGLKPVEALGNRAWSIKDNAKLLKLLQEYGLKKKDCEVVKVISPTEAEKLFKKVNPEGYVTLEEKAVTRPKKNKVVPESDKRESIAPQGFSNEEEDLSFLD